MYGRLNLSNCFLILWDGKCLDMSSQVDCTLFDSQTKRGYCAGSKVGSNNN